MKEITNMTEGIRKGGYLRSVICGLDSCMVILALTSRWNVKWVQ